MDSDCRGAVRHDSVGCVENPGPFTRAQLAQLGIADAQLTELLRQGRLRRIRRGWFAQASTPEAAVRAVQLGGRLGCLSACQAHGLWVPHHTELHVALNPGARAPSPHPAGVAFHRLGKACGEAVLPVVVAVAQVLHRHDEETGLIVLESAVNRGLIHDADARHLLATVPLRARRTAQHFSPLAESGSETRLRLFFQRIGVPVEPQALIPGVGRVDLLVGRSWILEADSQAYHSSSRQVATDRSRDLQSRIGGYVSDRLSYEQIWFTWEHTQQWLLDMVRTRKHRRAPVPLRSSR